MSAISARQRSAWAGCGCCGTATPRLTLLPDILWLAVFWLATMSALVYGGVTLLHL